MKVEVFILGGQRKERRDGTEARGNGEERGCTERIEKERKERKGNETKGS